ncbi:nitrile hydratase subunit beta [Alisedimentitalea sp. MJ-SS2]|uniref:nitrile hydratase subunit beta n=1 Tax=Aliisedimentitalea sp. MJ-SS2 TaxID=3049795 RepID=UPI002911FFEE|nr:nitrile hydratase subunit beta [Alisedimentitalea sp. MJ-SS2]MDU8927258.1 nitrile hydratase subunit beta [Alisedimentitalea sp. MJ-SS2]
MSRIHDMGGRFGEGTIPDKDDAEVFHHDWHATAMAVTVSSGFLGGWNIDAGRHAREALRPRDYARFSYYERWMAALADLLVERGFLSTDDLIRAGQLADGTATANAPKPLHEKAIRPADVAPSQVKITPYSRDSGPEPLFQIGDRVRTANYSPNTTIHGGHTRLPGYAMGRTGTVVMRHGNHVLPDSNAHFMGEAPEPLYAVEFAAVDLWDGDAEDAGDSMVLDLWQSYLERAAP